MTGKLLEQYELLLNSQLGIKPSIGFVEYLDLLQKAREEFPLDIHMIPIMHNEVPSEMVMAISWFKKWFGDVE